MNILKNLIVFKDDPVVKEFFEDNMYYAVGAFYNMSYKQNALVKNIEDYSNNLIL